ncbi:bifunctional 3'-5' exonuclease/ATP-dependent helicase WRN-like [Tubulanus polymorphus]|uniref:bifunctional 3'-5' exonuclease/ATP-dependent helicase WRN-like n=1 Tax=Tubulanus polymorphus TaxID=672921 RepID=UPI003DA69B08
MIITPLLAIMQEQCEYLKRLGFSATYIGKDSSEENDIITGWYMYVFASPEQILGVDKYRNMLMSDILQENLVVIAVDEAHVVQDWGDSENGEKVFREWYGRVGEIRSLCPTKSGKLSKASMFRWLINELTANPAEFSRTLIFCTTIKETAELHATFKTEIDINQFSLYHSKTPDSVKEYIRQDMSKIDGNIKILIGTSAAGMGINFKCVNRVINFGPARDMDTLVQQMGRAGRDGSISEHLVIYHGQQMSSVKDLEIRSYLCSDQCRRDIMLKYYSDQKQQVNSDECCDNCSSVDGDPHPSTVVNATENFIIVREPNNYEIKD